MYLNRSIVLLSCYTCIIIFEIISIVSTIIIAVNYSNDTQYPLRLRNTMCKPRMINNIPSTVNISKKNKKSKDIILQLWNNSLYDNSLFCSQFSFAVANNMKSSNGISYMNLAQAIKTYQVNNTIILMLTDQGYINQFLNSYVTNHLQQYPNLIVSCISESTYKVFLYN